MELPKDAPAVKLWHSIPADALALELRANLEVGISTDEAGRRQQTEEINELPLSLPSSSGGMASHAMVIKLGCTLPQVPCERMARNASPASKGKSRSSVSRSA
jgi:hypothetical protein